MPTTRSQSKKQNEETEKSTLCYLAYGRYITNTEFRALDGCTGKELLSGTDKYGNPSRIVESLKDKIVEKKKHPCGLDGKPWTSETHYGMCGQSCPCCRKMVGDKFGACTICN